MAGRSESSREDCRLIVQRSSGLEVFVLKDSNLTTLKKLSDSPECRVFSWSCHGDDFAFCDRKSVNVLDGTDFTSKLDLPHPRTREIRFSPKGTYICLWEPYVVHQGEAGRPNLTVYRGSNQVVQYYQKKVDGWFIQWSDNEFVCARNVTNEVHFFEGGCPGSSPTGRLQHENLSSFSLSPGPPPFHVAVHIRGAKGAPSCVQMYCYPRVSGPGSVLANKSFYKADNVQMKWNNRGSGVLVLTATDVDKTGASYYGEQNLYYLSVKGDGNMVSLDKKGPVYSVEWSPNAKEFCVVYGFMPSKAALFNSKCDMVHDFGITHRNTALFNPQGNILCLAGFGNLRGNMEFWDMDKKKIISQGQASDSTTLSWSPDGIHIVTGTTAPRLREGNGFKVWHYRSILLHETEVPPGKELWGVEWQPAPPGTYPVPDLSLPPPTMPTTILPANKPKAQAYVPPALRGKPRPSTESDVSLSKNKRKRDAQKKAKQQQQQVGSGKDESTSQKDALATAQYLLGGGTKEESGGENEKRIKNLKKKLKQIELLKKEQAEGKKLEANQVDKIKLEESILEELSQLQV